MRNLRLCGLLAVSIMAQDARIEWLTGSQRFVTSGVYARARLLRDGRVALVYSDGPAVWVRYSHDRALSFGQPVLVANTPNVDDTNSELLELDNGWLAYTWNERPRLPNLPYTITMSLSKDGGASWEPGRRIFTGGSAWSVGVWEPIFLQLPNGILQVYFADESVFPNSGEQQITMLESRDRGTTWDAPRRVSFAPGFRDGMPVPCILPNGAGMVMAIEDNSVGPSHRFKPRIVWTPVDQLSWPHWVGLGTERRWDPLRTPIPESVYAGAPYIVQFPGGEMALAWQSTEGRPVGNPPEGNSVMRVAVGNEFARDFTNEQSPFPNIPENGNGLWNSLTVIDDTTIIALSSVSGLQPGGIWIARGLLRKATPPVAIDGMEEGAVIRLRGVQSGHWVGIDASNAIRQWAMGDGRISDWRIEAGRKGSWVLRDIRTSRLLTVEQSSAAQSALLVAREGALDGSNEWIIDPLSDDMFRLRNRSSGKFMDVISWSLDVGAGLNQYHWANTDNQKWRINWVHRPGVVGIRELPVKDISTLEKENNTDLLGRRFHKTPILSRTLP